MRELQVGDLVVVRKGSKYAGRKGKVLSFTTGILGERLSARVDFTGDGRRDATLRVSSLERVKRNNENTLSITTTGVYTYRPIKSENEFVSNSK